MCGWCEKSGAARGRQGLGRWRGITVGSAVAVDHGGGRHLEVLPHPLLDGLRELRLERGLRDRLDERRLHGGQPVPAFPVAHDERVIEAYLGDEMIEL